jgi:hypothetical protein
MPKKVLVVVEGYLPDDVTEPGEPVAPAHPIYIPVEPPPETGLSPEHPIYIPVEPPPEVSHPIAPGGTPGTPTHPIAPGGPPPTAGHLPAPTPGHPIYVPVPPPPDSGLSPEHPIYLPVPPPEVSEPGQPAHPIVLPPYVDNALPGEAQREEAKEALRAFLFGNLPPSPGHVEPM